jgi:RNA polymerase sigma factor FliA
MQKLQPGELSEAWDDYKLDQSIEARNQLVIHYGSLVRYVAAKVAMGLPSMVDRDDLISYGQFGLIEAIEAYDLERGVKFETYAVARIRGSIIDELRKIDWVPRSIRSKVRDIEKTRAELHLDTGREPTDTEIAERMSVSPAEVTYLVSQAHSSLIAGLEESIDERTSISDVTFDVASNPEDLIETSEVSDLVALAVANMPERYKTILVLYYIEQMTLEEIGGVLGVTESRVCQLQSKVLAHLRDTLSQGALSAA